MLTQLCLQSLAGTDSDSQKSSTVILKGVGATLLEADIRRLVAPKMHLPDFKDGYDIVRVIPSRDVNSLDRRPVYHLTFANSIAAQEFATSMTPDLDQNSPPWSDVRFPPGSRPEFAVSDRRSTSVTQPLIVDELISSGGGQPGQCVLLTICGVGGRTRSTGKLPRTDDVRAILEENDVELCKEDLQKGGSGVQRIVLETPGVGGKKGQIVKANGRGLGAESRWLIRCRNSSEAHRVVRELHMREPWEGCGKFRAEVIH
ncbi:hypothetical protein FN846DRAFT_788968 [Sphaerosporella brunnea]|uniref:Uncharacterized protein n=1 Tax=Sphaerosporella brunnea TaxID=1250544 RepID=A0A5J5ED43_9PEZI|nr:hypothetical protein FN846DRAFT_788968 [Sphaerosporella brunnea]